MIWNTVTIKEFEQAVKEILKIVSSSYQTTSMDHACIVCLQGDLGAGKTTATQIIAKVLGVEDNVQSPTFVIRKAYPTKDQIFKTLVHMDAYRLEGEQGLDTLRLDDDFRMPNALMVIEWPEMIKSIIPSQSIQVLIEYTDIGRKIILIELEKKTAD